MKLFKKCLGWAIIWVFISVIVYATGLDGMVSNDLLITSILIPPVIALSLFVTILAAMLANGDL